METILYKYHADPYFKHMLYLNSHTEQNAKVSANHLNCACTAIIVNKKLKIHSTCFFFISGPLSFVDKALDQMSKFVNGEFKCYSCR